MENALFIYTDNKIEVEIERFHLCTWEFNNNSSLVEFGFEISERSLIEDKLIINILIPWVTNSCRATDFYEKLRNSENSRFIFNDSVITTNSLDGGRNQLGVIHKFSERNELCILPTDINIYEDKIVTIKIDLKDYQLYKTEKKSNIYFRFSIEPTVPYISMRKNGISRSTIIYDIKINEQRNIPSEKVGYFRDKSFCRIKNCFSFNIVPNKYDIVFFDNSSLKNIRTLEYESFNKYLGDNRVKKDDLIVVFNKKQNLESFSFFSIFSMERIGPGQFALAILINIICGVLLFIPSYRKTFDPELSFKTVWSHIPIEIYIALAIAAGTFLYFVWPIISIGLNKVRNSIKFFGKK